jgi:hypothetical protein
VGVPLGKGKVRYLNLAVAGRVYAEPKILTLHLDQCQLGPLDMPPRLLNTLSPVISSGLGRWRLSRPFVEATQDITIQPGSLEVTYGRVHLQPHGFREEIFGSEALGEEILAATRAQVNYLLTLVSQTADKPPEFGQCLETVFALARARSADRDPVIENRGAIFALGMLLGHRRFEEFLGSVRVGSQYHAAQRTLRRVTLRGRSDWTRHFCLSAAICLLSDDVVSDAAGLLKEELDAGAGGSGFSFTDLLADQAGTTFATLAVRDTTTARALQNRLARGFEVDDFFPEAADLPEGIPDAELQSRYGGVGGEGYRRIMAEIERRLADCPGFRVLRRLGS